MKTFYSHLIEIESIIVELDKMDLSQQEKLHLAKLVDSSLHSTILDVVLSQLGDDDKRIFLNNLKNNDHAKIWKFLNEKIDKIEDKIKNCADDLKKELHKDIKQAKRVGL